MEKEIKIIDFETKESKEGRIYHRFKTSEGWMSCFEKDFVEILKQNVGKYVVCEVVEVNGFKNIKSVSQKETGESKRRFVEDNKPTISPREVIDKPSFYVSYAKDVFIALLGKYPAAEENKAMEKAIELVEQARKAFS